MTAAGPRGFSRAEGGSSFLKLTFAEKLYIQYRIAGDTSSRIGGSVIWLIFGRETFKNLKT